MSTKNQNAKIIFGLKVKQLRSEKQLSFADLAKASGMSVSYLNEIEKGKKYPKEQKMATLAAGLEVSVNELTSQELGKNLQPVADLLNSNFLNDLPLDLFGIELYKVVEIIANSPLRVGAFISTLVELARNYALQEENFYHSAMRSYQELHNNYFEEIEQAAEAFVKQYFADNDELPRSSALFRKVLKTKYQYTIDESGLAKYPDLRDLRAVYIPHKNRLLLNKDLTNIQKAFQFGKELGFQYLELKARANTSSLLKVNSFEEVLNHFKASYFATALIIPQDEFVKDLDQFFFRSHWHGESFAGLMEKYNASAEMLFQRLTNLIPRYFGMERLFFHRFIHQSESDLFVLDKELYLKGRHHPHSNGLSEHYCRRWSSVSLLRDLQVLKSEGKYTGTIVGAQRSRYFATNEEYLLFTLARPTSSTPNQNVGVTIGLLIDETLRQKIKFVDDPAIGNKEVDRTCERCPIEDCADRAAPAIFVKRKAARKKVQDALKRALEE